MVVGDWGTREARLSLRGRGLGSILATLMKISTRTTQREPLRPGDGIHWLWVLRVE